MEEYSYNGQFIGNILVVGRTGCGKTTFIEKLARNKLFGVQIKHVFWVSKIVLSPEREEIIRESFVDQELQFCYPHDIEDFNYLMENFTQKNPNYLDNEMGENLTKDKLIVMDNVSGLADKSTDFSNFLTVSRKYGFSCVYVFHTIYPYRQNWEILMSQTHIFNFFPGSIHNSKILKILSLFANRQKNTYLPNLQIWLNKLYYEISNSKEKKCLTIDTRDINEFGPGKFRTSAEDGEQQTCYFNKNSSDSYFKSFISQRMQAELITFSIFKAKSDINFQDKNLDIFIKSSVSNGESEGELQQFSEKSIRNGSSRNNGIYDNITESANVRK